ncbi:hypothetical protein [Bradyrhizobium sp. SZCCHNR1002]|uniref:hypothetical protein n=1 Tax=Bradyrhizobium sp. SZCCHNR1002 TaxID=3057334 RepID=UPI0028EA327A|nr:hypothetical protein [Bradyrhizobium sp. SZCCHNR1002]
MADLEDVKDPILRVFALETLNTVQALLNTGIYNILHGAKKSLNGSVKAPKQAKEEGNAHFHELELRRNELHLAKLSSSASDQLIRTASRALRSMRDATEYYRSTRNFFVRFTKTDHNLFAYKEVILSIENDLDLAEKAIFQNDETAKKEVYQKVFGERLDQLDAPYLFDIQDFKIELTSPPNSETTPTATEGLALLLKEAHALASSLAQTNVDRRFVSAINEYIDALTEQNFSPIKVDLFSNKLRFYLVEMKDELPGFAIAEVSALLLSQERVLRQFPAWRAFEADASNFNPDEETSTTQEELLAHIANETKGSTDIASTSVLEALDRLIETSEDPLTKKTAELGVWRSVENFLKTNIKHVVDAAKSVQQNVTQNQLRYLKYAERLLPAARLYATMDSSRAWLLPVIQLLEDTIKQMKK